MSYYALCGAISAAKGHHRASRGPANTVAVHVQCAVQRGAGRCRAVQGRACTCQNTAIAPPATPASALASLVWSSQGMGGLAWHGMVWLGARARCFHNEVRCYLPTQYLKIEFGTFCQIIAAPPSGFREGIRRQFRRGMFQIFAKSFILVRHIYWIFRLLRGGWLGCTRAFVKWHLWPYPLKFCL